MRTILQSAAKQTYNQGDLIYKSGSIGSEIYVLIAGEVKLIEEVEGYKYEDETLTSGDHFGTLGFILKKLRSESAICNQDNTVIMSIGEYQINRNLSTAYKVFQNITIWLSRKLREKNHRFSNQYSIRPRDHIKRMIDNFDQTKSFVDSLLSETVLVDKAVNNIDFTSASIAHSQLKSIAVNRCNSQLGDLSVADCESVTVNKTLLTDAKFTASHLYDVVFLDCDLRATDFSDVLIDDLQIIHESKQQD